MKNKRKNIRYFRINHFFYFFVMHLYSPSVNSIYKNRISPDIPFLLWKPDFCFRILFFYMLI